MNSVSLYDAMAPSYAAYALRRQAYLDAVDDVVLDVLPSSGSLLDIGAGDGRRTEKFFQARQLSRMVAIEPSAAMAALCRARLSCPVHEVGVEAVASLGLPRFDTVTLLWNVLGHLPERSARIAALETVRDHLAPRGCAVLDVNNRHNARAYGWGRVVRRRVVDAFAFDERRGDAVYFWDIDGQKIRGYGHLFIAREIETLIRAAGLAIENRFSIDYTTGVRSPSPFQGQLVYVVTTA